MKTLYLIRHSKSEWANESLKDIDRPLNNRGYRDAYFMSEFLNKKKILPDVVITSPAIRAISTALIFCKTLELNSAKIIIVPSLYETTDKEYFKVINQINDSFEIALLFGHNPVISNFSNLLTNEHIEEIPTCGIVGINNESNHWSKFGQTKSKIIFSESPKNNI